MSIGWSQSSRPSSAASEHSGSRLLRGARGSAVGAVASADEQARVSFDGKDDGAAAGVTAGVPPLLLARFQQLAPFFGAICAPLGAIVERAECPSEEDLLYLSLIHI